MSFRDDGAAALEWVASYLERVRELPVLAQVAPGELRSRLPEAPPETAEPCAAVLRDLDESSFPPSRTGRARPSSPTSRPPAPSPGSSPSC